ncbi:hypothetical protein L1049_001907 [Liquidambar formosana]|uniref:Uncharacterized protein n=1 Tax=Liquidambar formosana TaxID=63359 RepID=A0AAP0NDX9_LIQFO
MAKFSVGGEDDIEGPSSRRQKRPRIFVEEENEDENCEEEVEEDGEDEEEDEEDEEDEEEEESQSEDGEGRVGSNGGGLSVGPNRDGSIRVTLTDPEVLDCSICYDSLKIPVYQAVLTLYCISATLKEVNKCNLCKRRKCYLGRKKKEEEKNRGSGGGENGTLNNKKSLSRFLGEEEWNFGHVKLEYKNY